MQPLHEKTEEEKIGTLRVLVEEGGCDPLTEAPNNIHSYGTPLHCFRGGAELLHYLLYQDHFIVDMDSSSFEMTQIAFTHILHSCANGPALARMCLSKGDGLMWLARPTGHILNFIARNIFHNQLFPKFPTFATVKGSFGLLLQDAVRAGADLHDLNNGTSPLVELGCGHDSSGDNLALLSERILLWLGSFRDAGCDLQDYIETECAINDGRLRCQESYCQKIEQRARTMSYEKDPTSHSILWRIKQPRLVWRRSDDHDPSDYLPSKKACPGRYLEQEGIWMREVQEICFFVNRRPDQDFGLHSSRKDSFIVDAPKFWKQYTAKRTLLRTS